MLPSSHDIIRHDQPTTYESNFRVRRPKHLIMSQAEYFCCFFFQLRSIEKEGREQKTKREDVEDVSFAGDRVYCNIVVSFTGRPHSMQTTEFACI